MTESTGVLYQGQGAPGTTDNIRLMESARQKLTGKWHYCAGATFIFCIISGLISAIPKIGGLISLIINGPLMLGFTIFFLMISRDGKPELGAIFNGFNRFRDALVTYLLMVLFIVLWSLLLIVPGIIAALSYSMTFYIMADNQGITGMDALKKSKEMMMGYKLKLFYLGLRFIGWALLCILTAGIGFFWLIPYISTSSALFYHDIQGRSSSTMRNELPG